MSEFKDIILQLRNEKGFTQGQMADALGTSKSTVGMWEMGERFPSKELYESIADYFNVDMDYLYGRTEIRKKNHFDNDGTEYVPASSVDNFPDDIRAAARGMMELSEVDRALAINMIKSLSQKGREAKEN